MNSFRFLERGIEAEIERQEAILRDGRRGRAGDAPLRPAAGALTSLRSKEEAHDYRYFPEPDLVPIAPTEEMLERARAALPELPAARAERLERELGLPADTAQAARRSARELGDFFEAALAGDGGDPRALANWVTNELIARIGDADPADRRSSRPRSPGSWRWWPTKAGRRPPRRGGARRAGRARAATRRRSSSRRASAGPATTSWARSSTRRSPSNPDAVEKIRAGKGKAIGAIVGAVMRETKGRADGGEVQRMIREKLALAGQRRRRPRAPLGGRPAQEAGYEARRLPVTTPPRSPRRPLVEDGVTG